MSPRLGVSLPTPSSWALGGYSRNRGRARGTVRVAGCHCGGPEPRGTGFMRRATVTCTGVARRVACAANGLARPQGRHPWLQHLEAAHGNRERNGKSNSTLSRAIAGGAAG